MALREEENVINGAQNASSIRTIKAFAFMTLPDFRVMKKLIFLFTVLFFIPDVQAQDVLTPERLWQLQRVSDAVVSPDGSRLVYGVRTFDVPENKGNTDLFLLPVAGGEPVRLTAFPGTEFGAQWHPSGRKIGFLSSESGSVQLWEINPDGTDLRQVSDLEGGINNFRYAPTGRHVSFTRDIKLDPTVQDLFEDLPKADARIIDDLMYRHWNSWHDYAYSHLFIAPYEDGTLAEAQDLMPGEKFDTPLNPFGGVEQISWHPDGRRMVYTSKKLHGAAAALSTNADLYLYDLDTGVTTNLTEGMMGYDLEPVISPDGRTLAWLSMARDGYEADRNRLFVYDFEKGTRRELTIGFDQNAQSPAWSGDSRTLYFNSDAMGTVQLYAAQVDPGTIHQLTAGVHNYGGFAVAETAGKGSLIASRVSMSSPAELFRVDAATGEAVQLTFANKPLLDRLALGKVEKRMTRATDGKEILSWVIYPPDFDPSKKYPALLYCQGGPQSAVSQFFSYRWNFQLMAAAGYIVVAPNRRGLPGFGQDWNEEISGDWGGQAMRDLLSAIDDVAAEPYVDDTRLGAIGASYGGYSVYWLAGNHEKRFKTFIAHAGVFNLESMYGATEELFFPNFDLEGPYWQEPMPMSYEAFSPHRFVKNWDTPMLVIHGQKDFRVPVTEGMQAFTALQEKGIPSRFLYFPEEGHWIQQPQNGILWHRVFFDWLGRSLKRQDASF